MWDGGDETELLQAGHTITDSKSWVKAMTELALKAEKEERTEHAIAYWRMAEFFMYDGDKRKKSTYQKAVDLFYQYYPEPSKSDIRSCVVSGFKQAELIDHLAVMERK